jgi:hypothetical protein
MNLEYVPLLQVARDLHEMPRTYERFQEYLRVIFGPGERTRPVLPPLIAMNPMGKDHVKALLDALLTLDADAIAAQVVSEAAAQLAEEPGGCKVALVVADDLLGGWTNRYATEFTFRFGPDQWRFLSARPKPQWLEHWWITAVLWSSEPASERAVREAILTAVYRIPYMLRHGPACTLRDMLTQEGEVMARAGCTSPTLDEEDIAYTREVLLPYLDAEDMRTCMECLFGDEPSRTLGFTPMGLSPWAGLALALHDGRARLQLTGPACE